MIPFNFNYYRPSEINEAVDCKINLDKADVKTLYYGGGSEIISMSRSGSISPKAVIDIKAIPLCKEFKIKDDKIVIGSAVSLTEIVEKNLFPLLSTTVRRISDHTNQCKITLGGNICGTIIYKESVLPLLLTDSSMIVAGEYGTRTVKIKNFFDKRIILKPDEFIVQFIIDKTYDNINFYHKKNVKAEKIDYPLITVVAIKLNNRTKIGISGLLNYPFRSIEIENYLNDNSLSFDKKFNKIVKSLPDEILSDLRGSTEYRKFVLRNNLIDILNFFGEKND
jgi:CO/xanthine dehydrogenase FAD-binding subunit